MIRFVEKPHLPQGKVRQIIIGEKYKNVLESALFEQNTVPFWLKNNDFVDERLSVDALKRSLVQDFDTPVVTRASHDIKKLYCQVFAFVTYRNRLKTEG